MTNQELIQKFYTAFQNGDYKTMQTCYSEDATFSDAVFQNLNSNQTKAMWHMLVEAGKVDITYSNILSNEQETTCDWTATYTFSLTKKNVVNKIDARFIIQNGLIIQHLDSFNLYHWAKQAFGLTGTVLGWTNMFQNTIRNKAQQRLHDFIAKHNQYQK